MIVLDASLALEVFAKTPRGERLAGHVFTEQLHAPHLLDLEVAQVLRRLVVADVLEARAAEAALERLQNWEIERHDHTSMLPRIWELRNSLSAYDASYIALAEVLDVSLLTCDGKLGRSHGHRANIVLLS
ncbi:MAG: type II toxin-antitoxin system VapC family toxin [Rhizomicrobium sp.]